MISSLETRSRHFLDQLRDIQTGQERAQRQITSGRRLNRASDDPTRIPSILALHSSIDRTAAHRSNLERVRGEVKTADTALQQAVSLLDRAAILGSQGASETLDADKRQILARELRDIQKSLVDVTRTEWNGRYVFAGDQDATPPFKLDPAADTGVQAGQNAAATRRIATLSGDSFSVDRTAAQIFDVRESSGEPAAANVFAAIEDLAQALESNGTAVLPALVSRVRKATEHVSGELSRYGLADNRLSREIDHSQALELQMRTRLSALEDTDLTEAILELTQSRQHLEAAIGAQGQIPRSTLFDILG